MAYADKARLRPAGLTNHFAQTSAFDLHGLLLFQSLMLTRPRSDHERTLVFGTDQLAASKLAFAYTQIFRWAQNYGLAACPTAVVLRRVELSRQIITRKVCWRRMWAIRSRGDEWRLSTVEQSSNQRLPIILRVPRSAHGSGHNLCHSSQGGNESANARRLLLTPARAGVTNIIGRLACSFIQPNGR